MTQCQLHRAVARATGETLSTIRQRGFSPLVPAPPEDEREPLVMDWDAADSPRESSLFVPSGKWPTAA